MFYIDDNQIGHFETQVLSADTDCFYSAKPVYYFALNQELGGLHASEKHCGVRELMDNEGMTWMVIRAQVTIHKPASWQNILSIDTWCQEGYRLYCPRFLSCHDKKTGERIFDSLTYWIVMDTVKKRPLRPSLFDERIPAPEKSVLYRDPVMSPFPEEAEFTLNAFKESEALINYYDTDYNKHVNNLSYINWALDAFSKEYLDKMYPTRLDVKWERQSFLDDKLRVITKKKDNSDEFLTKIMRGDECVFSLYSAWKER